MMDIPVVNVDVLTVSPEADRPALLAQATDRLARYGGSAYTPVDVMRVTLGLDGLWHWTVQCVRPARPTTKMEAA